MAARPTSPSAPSRVACSGEARNRRERATCPAEENAAEQPRAPTAEPAFGLGGARQTMVELDHAYLLVTEAGPSACLALIAHADADLALVAYETNRVVQQAGPHLASEPRKFAGKAPNGAVLPRDPTAAQVP